MANNSTSHKSDHDMIYQLEGRPSLGLALPLGFQHVLAMFVGNLAPILVLSGVLSIATGEKIISDDQRIIMIQCAMFISGLTTFIQLYPVKIGKFQIGGGLPIVMGTSFAFVPTFQTIGAQFGISGILGATLSSGIVQVLMGIFIVPLKKYFPPLVIGSVLLTIGLHLLSVGTQYFAGGAASQFNSGLAEKLIAEGKPVPENVAMMAAQYGSWQNLVIGTTVFVIIMALQRFGKGMMKVSGILIGIIAGYILSIALGQINFEPLIKAALFSPPIPFYIKPTFHMEAIFAVAAIYVVSSLETLGNTNGITVAAFDREATAEEVSGAILADAVGSMTASVFNTLPNTAFGQNAGIVAMTKVVNKWCIATGAFVLMIAGLCPKIGAMFSIMPQSVLGGAVITVFAMIMINGMKLIAKAGFSDRNVLILAITFGIGYGIGTTPSLVAKLPEVLQFIFRDTTAAVCIVSVIANLLFPPSEAERAAMDSSH